MYTISGGHNDDIAKKTGLKYKTFSKEVKINSGIQRGRSAPVLALHDPQQIMVHCFPASRQQ